MIRVVIPAHLRTLSGVTGELQLSIDGVATQRNVVDAIEAAHPALKGTIRDHGSDKRRPMIRFYACQEDLSHESPDTPLPEKVQSGQEIYYVIAAISGG